MRDLGATNWNLQPIEDGPWLSGRSASIIVEGKVVGQCGEVDPKVSQLFELSVPMSGAQINISALQEVLIDPVH